MEYYEEESEGGRLYNREVLGLLFRYLFRYRKYLIIALAFVFLITGSNLAVPVLFRTIVDRFIFKQGRIVDSGGLAESLDDRRSKTVARRTIPLSDSDSFILRSDLRLFSSREVELLVADGLISEKSYLLVETEIEDPALGERIENLIGRGAALNYGEGRLLFETSILNSFRVSEIVLLRGKDFRRIVQLIAIIFAILLIQFTATYTQIVFLMRLSQQAMRDLRRDLFAHILSRETSYFDRNPIGKLVNRVTNDIEKLNELFSSVLVTLFQDILMLLGITAIMFLTSVTLALIVAISFPFLAFFIVLFRIQVRNAYRKIRSKISELNSFLNETITGIRIVQIFVREIANYRKFMRRNDGVYHAQLGQLYINAVFMPLIGFMHWFAIAAVIYFGARGIVQDRVSYGLLVMFIAYIERFFHPIRDLSGKFDIMQSANAAGEKILAIFKEEGVLEEPALPSKSTAVGEDVFTGRIEFRDVWFCYKPDEWVLKGVSFILEPKRTLAIVGETGAGKSTIIGILSRFYEVQRGQVLIDGTDIRDIPYERLRSRIVTVMQDVFLFSRSVRDNVILGAPYDADRFRQAAAITHIDRFIEALPDGEDEQVMERGATFSAGERQLLSFARALYADPSVLVLDEATSSIDTETERLIQDAIIRLVQDRTSIVVAHRLSTIKHAHSIIVLDQGRVVERGSHSELLERDGLYSRLYKLQFSALS
jgi:ABC-type multidrug transport system fused ATPase/permease subunit